MLYYTIPYHTIPYHTILYYTILYYTILYYTIPYHTILYYTILYSTLLYSTLLYSTLLYSTLLYYTILYYTILYYTISYDVRFFASDVRWLRLSREASRTRMGWVVFPLHRCPSILLGCAVDLGNPVSTPSTPPIRSNNKLYEAYCQANLLSLPNIQVKSAFQRPCPDAMQASFHQAGGRPNPNREAQNGGPEI